MKGDDTDDERSSTCFFLPSQTNCLDQLVGYIFLVYAEISSAR